MENLLIFSTAILGAVGAYWISVHLEKGPVLGSAIVTLLSGLIFPRISPELGTTLAAVATSGSYAGMVSLKNVPKLWEMIFIGMFVGSIFIVSSSVYVGIGGKLGTIAAISCLAWLGLKKTYKIGLTMF